MYNVMVIEDEYIERQALVLMLRNNFPDISEIADAGNGFEALDMARIKKPDIVFVDLGLPGINGLDVIEEMRNISTDIIFIIISSHDNFEFAQRAIKLGVEDYLLKPVRIEALQLTIQTSITKKESRNEVNATTTTLLNKMDNIRPLVENDFIYSIISNVQGESLRQMLAFLGIEESYGFCLVISKLNEYNRLHGLIKLVLERLGNKSLAGFFNDHSVLCLMATKNMENNSSGDLCEYIVMNLRKNGYTDFHIGVSEPVEDPSGWPIAYRQAKFALMRAEEEDLFLKIFDGGILAPTGNSINLSQWADLLARVILDNKEDQQKKVTEQISLILMSNYEFNQAREEAYKCIILLREELTRMLPMMNFQAEIGKNVLENEQPGNLETYMASYIIHFSHMVNEIRDQSKNTLVDRAMLYIKANYQNEISLGSVAREIDISPYYLSKLFRKYTGKTCTELIAEERVEAAKKLLLQNHSSKETCYQVGFNSQNYFSKIFKKFTGLTPGEFRSVSLT